MLQQITEWVLSYLTQKADFYKTVPKAGDYLITGPVDGQKIYAEVRRLILLRRRIYTEQIIKVS